MRPVGESPTLETYRDFGEREADDSPCFTAWARGVADDAEVLALVDTLPPGKRQPNLLFAAARWHGASTGGYDGLRTVLTARWDEVRATMLARATQTNEAGRCATLLPVLAGLPGPLALVEVGASAGLCLAPDRYSYRWTTDTGLRTLDPAGGPSPVVLDCVTEGDVPIPDVMPEVVWRAGIDLHPLDVADDDAAAWLETLVWPEHEARRARLSAAIDLVRQDPPRLVAGDLLDRLPEVAADVPDGATLVVFHSAVLAYLSSVDRERFVDLVSALPGHWVSNEGPRVLPGLRVPPEPPAGSAVGSTPFLLALDGQGVGWTHGHGQAVRWSRPSTSYA